MRQMLSVLAVLVVLCVARPVWAQATVVNASSGVAFTASTDHNATDGFGQARVTRYDMDILVQSTSVVFTTVNLGKPTPAPTTNLITVDPVAAFGTLTPGTVYVARVRAVNASAASANSANTSPFGIPAPLAAPSAPSAPSIVP